MCSGRCVKCTTLGVYQRTKKNKNNKRIAHDNEQTGDSTLFNGLRFPGGKMKQAHFYLLPLCLPHSLGHFM